MIFTLCYVSYLSKYETYGGKSSATDALAYLSGTGEPDAIENVWIAGGPSPAHRFTGREPQRNQRAFGQSISACLERPELIGSKRRGLWVHYRPATSEETGEPIATPLRMKFGRGQKPIDLIFRLSTAFTHPRRVEILRALKQRPRTLAELRQVTGVPRPSLLRHLHKLITRGFVRYQRQRRRVYISLRHPDAFGRALAALC
jgi:regulatory ArsR family protein